MFHSIFIGEELRVYPFEFCCQQSTVIKFATKWFPVTDLTVIQVGIHGPIPIEYTWLYVKVKWPLDDLDLNLTLDLDLMTLVKTNELGLPLERPYFCLLIFG